MNETDKDVEKDHRIGMVIGIIMIAFGLVGLMLGVAFETAPFSGQPMPPIQYAGAMLLAGFAVVLVRIMGVKDAF